MHKETQGRQNGYSVALPLHKTPFLRLGGFNYSFWGWTLSPFLPAPLLISFGAVPLLTKNTACLRQSVCNASSRKEAFEEKANDQNKEREVGGRSRQEAGAEGSELGGQALISLHRLLPLAASLFHCWGERNLLPGYEVLRQAGEAAVLKRYNQMPVTPPSNPQRESSRALRYRVGREMGLLPSTLPQTHTHSSMHTLSHTALHST